MRILVWNEFIHERSIPSVQQIYPDGIHQAIARPLRILLPEADVQVATMSEAEHGLDDERLSRTDVLFWWGHAAHDRVEDHVVERIHRAVLAGLGLIVLHSGHASKIFQRLMGTTCMLRWRDSGERERLWVVDPSHPIVDGINSEFLDIPVEEMYGEHFDIPAPDELILISWFAGGEVFRSGCTFRRGKGKIFYFRPGHETFPTYHHPQVQRVLANAARWAAPSGSVYCGVGREIREPLR